jgi:hypothetical protein
MTKYATANHWVWDGTHEEVCLVARHHERSILCRISRAAIENRFGSSGEQKPLHVAKQNFHAITDRLGEKIASQTFEDDGTILIRAEDW